MLLIFDILKYRILQYQTSKALNIKYQKVSDEFKLFM